MWKLFVLFLLYLCENVNSDVICEDGYCQSYVSTTGCAATMQECSINNATHNGIYLPSPTLCNCCTYCLPTYPEGHHCSLGGVGDGLTVGRCGDGMTCVTEDAGNFCRRIPSTESECHAKQDDYDSRHEQGQTGALEVRPSCNAKGRFSNVHCVPTQTCFCQSEDGERLFGEMLYEGDITLQNMQCGCSLHHHKIEKNINAGLSYPTIGPRCSADGNFNPIQCLNRVCYCVNKITGVIRQDQSINLDDEPISKLPCYEADLDLFPGLWLNDAPYNYTTPCFEEMKLKIILMEESQELGYNIDYHSSVQGCLPDGTYGRVLVTANLTKICIDERGERIGDYEAAINTDEYDNMDCKCAVTSHIMSNAVEKPVCCSNGSFRQVQCRRGFCRCVDEDGRQVGQESADATALPCYTASDWQTC